VASVEPTPIELCDSMLAHFTPAGRDDIALLVLRRPG
jgi:hypothetical protein